MGILSLHCPGHQQSYTYLGAPFAQLVECGTLDHKVAGSNLTVSLSKTPGSTRGKCPDMTENLLTGT